MDDLEKIVVGIIRYSLDSYLKTKSEEDKVFLFDQLPKILEGSKINIEYIWRKVKEMEEANEKLSDFVTIS